MSKGRVTAGTDRADRLGAGAPCPEGASEGVALGEATIAELVQLAEQARESAYAPYSRFMVGAAVLCESGRIYPGVNVENASYGLTICAERAAVFAAVTAGERRIRAVAIVTDADRPTPPCGACRQVLYQFAAEAVVIAANRAGRRQTWRLDDLLPEAFSLGSAE